MNLQLNKLANHDIRCIVVPKENLSVPVSDIETITYKDNKFIVLDFISIYKDEKIPMVLKLLSTGQYVSDDKIWEAYNKSSKLFFFIVEKS